MNWSSKHKRVYEPIDFSRLKSEDWNFINIQEKKNKLMNSPTWNIWRMRLYYVVLVVVGGLTALHGSGLGDFTTIIGILTAIETELKA